MPSVTIVKPFTFTHTFVRDPDADDGSAHPKISTTDDINMHGKDEFVPVGVHEMSPAMANNWYVLAHSSNPPPAAPKPGTPEYGAKAAAAVRRRQMVEAAIEQEAAAAAQDIRHDANLSGRLAETEEQVHAEEAEQEDLAAEQAAKDEAVRTGRRVAIPPPRRASAPAPIAPTGVQQPHPPVAARDAVPPPLPPRVPPAAT